MIDKCDWCGSGIPRTDAGHTTGIRIGSGFMKLGRLYCSNACKSQGEASHSSGSDSSSSGSSNSKSSGGMFSTKSNDERLAEQGLSGEEIAAINRESARQRAEESAANADKTVAFYNKYIRPKQKVIISLWLVLYFLLSIIVGLSRPDAGIGAAFVMMGFFFISPLIYVGWAFWHKSEH